MKTKSTTAACGRRRWPDRWDPRPRRIARAAYARRRRSRLRIARDVAEHRRPADPRDVLVKRLFLFRNLCTHFDTITFTDAPSLNPKREAALPSRIAISRNSKLPASFAAARFQVWPIFFGTLSLTKLPCICRCGPTMNTLRSSYLFVNSMGFRFGSTHKFSI